MKLDEAISRARGVAREVLWPQAADVDAQARWPSAGIRALQDAGLGGLAVPSDCGGAGLGLAALARVCEALGECCASTAICFGMHTVGSAVIAARATTEQKERYLVPIAAGRHLTTLALSEPGTGAHFFLPQARLSRVSDGGLVLSGTKSFVTNGAQADSYVVSTAPADPQPGPGGFACVVVSRDARGVTWGVPWDGWGVRGNAAVTMTLAGVAVPAGDVLAADVDEAWYIFHVVARHLLAAVAGSFLGVAVAALEEGRRHLLKRTHTHSGASLAENPILQHRLGALYAQVARTRSLVHDATELADAGASDALPALCAAKAEVADCADRVTSEVMTLLGGRGYRDAALIQRLYRDARAAHVMSPTTDILRTWTGRALLGLPLLGE